MVSFHEFLNELGVLKTQEIPFYFRNQFKIKENFINPNSRHFESIAQKLLMEEKSGIKRKWDKQCKMLFIWVMVKFFTCRNKRNINPNQEEWVQLSQILNIEELTLKQRWITLINPIAKSINWDPEEDEIIKSLMNEQEEKHIWTTIALELYNKNNGVFIRTPKQVRERWMNYLNPKLRKSNWSFDEDLQLLNLVVKHGKRWSLISSLLEGRTENQVKNRFKSLIHKIYKEEEDDDIEELQAIKEYLKKFNNDQQSLQFNLEQNNSNQLAKIQKKTYKRQLKSDKVCKKEIQTRQSQQEQKQEQQFEIQNQEIKYEKKVINLKEEEEKLPQDNQDLLFQQSLIFQKLQQQQFLQKQLQQQQQQQQQQHNNHQQFCLSIQGTCDTKSQDNRKDLSTPISLASFYMPFQEDLKSEQFKQYFNNTRQQPQSPLYQINNPQFSQYNTGFRPYQHDSFNDLFQQQQQQQQLQQTPVQLNRLLMEHCMKNNIYGSQFQQNLVSPFPNSTPMVYTPWNYFNYISQQQSPSMMIRSPFTEISPGLKQQYVNWFQQQQQQQQQENEMFEQEQFNSKLEFLKSTNLVDAWKSKRDAQKLNKVVDEDLI